MFSPYSKVFEEIFHRCSSYVCKDFSEIRGLNDRNGNESIYNFCLSTCTKIFDETIRVLKKVKYNGDVLLSGDLFFDRTTNIKIQSCINTSISLKKKEIVIKNNSAILLSNAKLDKDNKVKNRIILLPIDGISSFANGIPCFGIVCAYQQLENDEFITRQVVFFDPIKNDTYSFDDKNGCYVNNIKISNNKILQEKNVNSIYVETYKQVSSFNINKLNSISNTFIINNSIFYSICLLCTTKMNLIVCLQDKNKIIHDIISFCIKSANLNIHEFNEYMAIGEKDILQTLIR